jgi:hypothetical protein
MSILPISSLYSVNSSSYPVPTSPLSVKDALIYVGTYTAGRVTIADSAQNIAKYWDSLNTVSTNIRGISVTDSSKLIKLTADQFSNASTSTGNGLVDKVQQGMAFEITDTAAKISSLTDTTKIQSLNVLDSTSNIQNNLASLNNLGSKLKSLQVTDPSKTLTISASNYSTTYASVLAKLPTKINYKLTDVAVNDLDDYYSNKRVKSISVSDTIENIQSGIDTLQRYQYKINSVGTTSETNAVNITEVQAKKDAVILNKIYKGFDFNLLATSYSSAMKLNSSPFISHINVHDTAANITKNIKGLANLNDKINSVTLKDPQNDLKLSYAEASKYASALTKITSSYNVHLTNNNVTVDQFLDMETLVFYSGGHLSNANVADTGENINNAASGYAHPFYNADSLTVTDSTAIKSTFSNAEYNSKFPPTTTFDFGNLTLSSFLDASQYYRVKPTELTITSSELQSNFSKLAQYKENINSIKISDLADSLATLSQSDISNGYNLIEKISGNVSFTSNNPSIVDGDFKNLFNGYGDLAWSSFGSKDTTADHATISLGYTQTYYYTDGSTSNYPIDQELMQSIKTSGSKYLLSFNAKGTSFNNANGSAITYGISRGNDFLTAVSDNTASTTHLNPGESKRINLEISLPSDMQGSNNEIFITSRDHAVIGNVSLLRIS